MATRLQLRRGTSTENNNFTGAEAELTYDSTSKGLRIHDGSKQGGYMVDTVVAFQAPTASNNHTWYRKYASGWVEQGGRKVGTPSGNVFSITLPVPMANDGYFISLLPALGSTDTGNYYCRGIASSTGTQIKYFVYFNGGVTTNNPMVIWQVSGMAA